RRWAPGDRRRAPRRGAGQDSPAEDLCQARDESWTGKTWARPARARARPGVDPSTGTTRPARPEFRARPEHGHDPSPTRTRPHPDPDPAPTPTRAAEGYARCLSGTSTPRPGGCCAGHAPESP